MTAPYNFPGFGPNAFGTYSDQLANQVGPTVADASRYFDPTLGADITSGGGSLLSRILPSSLSNLSFTKPAGLGGWAAAAAPAIAGNIIGGGVENLGTPNSTSGDIWQAAGTGLKTAGLAASLTAPLGPEVQVPAAAGAFLLSGIGSLIHAGSGGGGPSADQLKGTLGALAQQGNLDPGTYQQMFDTYKQLGIQGTTTDAKGNQVSTGKAATDQEIAQKILGQVQNDAAAKQQQQQQFAN